MSRSVRRFMISAGGSPCFCSSAAYSLLYSVPVCGGFDLPSVVTVVTYTLPRVTIGDDHPRPGISRDHSTFSVFDQRSASFACLPTGFDSGPRNCGQSSGWPETANGTASSPAKSKPANDRREGLLTLRILFTVDPLEFSVSAAGDAAISVAHRRHTTSALHPSQRGYIGDSVTYVIRVTSVSLTTMQSAGLCAGHHTRSQL